jgi:hypothetical protein
MNSLYETITRYHQIMLAHASALDAAEKARQDFMRRPTKLGLEHYRRMCAVVYHAQEKVLNHQVTYQTYLHDHILRHEQVSAHTFNANYAESLDGRDSMFFAELPSDIGIDPIVKRYEESSREDRISAPYPVAN